MKIGIAVWNLDVSGGTERQALELARYLQRRGHDVEVYCAYYDPRQCFPEFIGEIRKIRCVEPHHQRRSGNIRKAHFYWDLLSRKSQALSQLISPDLDVLNCHEYPTFIAGISYRERTGVPVVGMLNDAPSVGGIYDPGDGARWFPFSWGKRVMFRSAIRQLDRIVVLDHINQERMRRYFQAESVIVRSGLDLAKFAFRERGRCGVPLAVLANGNFFPWRRYEDLIEAMRILADDHVPFHLNHVGTDVLCRSYARKIKNMVEESGLASYVTFHGYVGQERFFEIYEGSDVYVFPNFPQTWGLAVFEAMGCGIPTVVNSGCGAAEVLQHEETTLLVPPRSPREIARAIRRLAESPDLYRRLSGNGRRLVEREINWDRYGGTMLEQFSGTIRSHRSGSC